MQLNPYALAMIASALVAGNLALYIWWRRSAPGAGLFTLLNLAIAIWSFGYGMELASTDLATMLWWIKVEYLGIATLPALWTAAAIQYTGYDRWLTRPNTILLFAEPFLTLMVNWTNQWHYWFYSHVALDTSGPFPVLAITRGPWYWVHVVFSYLSLIGGTILFLQMFLRSLQLYRIQSGVMIASVLAPWITNVLYLSGLGPFAYLDLTPFAFTFTCLAVASSLFRFQMLNIVPVARDGVVEHMSEGMLVLDNQERLVDCNPAALRIFGWPQPPLGHTASELFHAWPELAQLHQVALTVPREIAHTTDTTLRFYEIATSALTNQQGKTIGRIIVIHDITTRKQAQIAAQEAIQRELQLAHSIQMSLLPQQPPSAHGLDIAGLSLPASEVGGDLYAYHKLPPTSSTPYDSYALAVGDVSGKGFSAALYMAVSTAILSAKAPLVADVAQLLDEMNSALHPYMSPNRMNTALCYVRLQPDTACGYTAHIANAGLIAPILRHGSHCSYLEVGGLPLGILLHGLPYATLTLPLQPHDMLVLSSDGIAEARNGAGELYGLERLRGRVASTPASSSAHETLQWILTDVQTFIQDTQPHDDMTLVVMKICAA